MRPKKPGLAYKRFVMIFSQFVFEGGHEVH
jgi:hypothetical protein